MSSIRTDCHCDDSIVVGTNVEMQLAGMNVDEPHDAVLAQYTKHLHKDKKWLKGHSARVNMVKTHITTLEEAQKHT